MDVHIRPATDHDHEACSHIARELNAMHADALPSRFRVAQDALPSDYFHTLVEADDATVLVAEGAGDILGHAILQLRESPPIPVVAPRRYVFLNDLVVTEAERGQGIGRRLVDASVDWARAQRASEIELGVFAFNRPAIAFYERVGFDTVKRTMSLPVDPG